MPCLGKSFVAFFFLLFCCACTKPAGDKTAPGKAVPVRASSACRDCHPAFYKKWATSHHGLAMQPFTPQFAASALSAQPKPIRIGGHEYQAYFDQAAGYIEERGSGSARKLGIQHVMGGKNVYYFLTPLDRGRLQVLPLAYDVEKKVWYDMAASGVRMHAGAPPEAPLPWTDSAYTFNTSCYSCHVSQLKTNYEVASDSYNSTWREPGINCESCHGDGQAHIALFRNNKGEKVEDMRILRTTKFTTVQRNEMCAPCHAKMSPISPGYQVTQRFYDHYDLVTIEDADYYPDGRDLGENYTYTSWLRNRCLRSGKFDCIHCHTSSGRYRFATENPNGACLPCHQEKAAKLEAHTHHKNGSPGSRCIDCHMPKTRFAAMNRSDHSLLPPTPAATIKYKSPNACNLCHQDKDATWADTQVREWHRDDYQKPVLELAALIDSARKRDWKDLPRILSYVRAKESDPVFVASLIRLLASCGNGRKWPAILESLKHPSPLVRAAAASTITGPITEETRSALVGATRDDYRLVRIRAAASLASVPVDALAEADREAVRRATEELLAAYQARPDDFANQTNLGNYYLEKGDVENSIHAFETAIRQRPDSVGTLVNASMAYSRAGQAPNAERVLRQALRTSPENAPANFNLGLLLAESNRTKEAETALRKALAADPFLHQAAFNLCVLVSQQNREEALALCRQANRLAPDVEKYAFTLGFYLNQAGKATEALTVLKPFVVRSQVGIDTLLLSAELLAKSGDSRRAALVYQTVLGRPNLEPQQRQFVSRQLTALGTR